MLRDDLAVAYRLTKGSKFSRFMSVCLSAGVHAIVVYRLGSWLLTKPAFLRLLLRPVRFLLARRVMSRWGIEISPRARIGKGFCIAHFGGIFIGGDVVIGDYFYTSHDVTIGRSGSALHKGLPVIGDNVYVAPGAKIVGNVRIGNNVKIGTNAVVDRDVPDNALVQMHPPQIVVFPSYATDRKMVPPDKEDMH